MKKVYLIAVVFALLAAFATYMFANQINSKTTLKDAETTPVVFALKEVEENTIITPEMLTSESGFFTVKNVPTDYAQPDYISKLEDMENKVTCVAIRPNEQIDSTMVVDEDSDEIGLSFKIKDGYEAVSLRASDVNGVDGFISAGDTVDIITTETDNNGKVKAKVAYKNLKVLRVSNNKANETAQSSDTKINEYSTITVEVTPDQVLKIQEITAESDYKLVLNSRKSDQKTGQKTTEAQTTAQSNNG